MSARPKLCLDIFEEQDEKEVLKFIKKQNLLHFILQSRYKDIIR
jgi:hypothetical protein